MFIKTEDKELEEIMKGIMLEMGAKVVEVNDISEVDFRKIDVLILDTREISDEWLFEFINEVKKVNQRLKVMIVTCKNNIKSSILVMKVGITEEIFFPIEVKQLKNRLKSLLKSAEKEKKEGFFSNLQKSLRALNFVDRRKLVRTKEKRKETLKKVEKNEKEN
ncbi:hypothetical protein [Thermodesulfobacterium sp. TA1]|uniref:hypothetical protein n=1 Tax=Thermodesulfobacterium sp. TA1 TaxID=2234087 RepID=UPI00143DF349|nr:hypothetical protein [Thermodesulfobacterium sp. TA1]